MMHLSTKHCNEGVFRVVAGVHKERRVRSSTDAALSLEGIGRVIDSRKNKCLIKCPLIPVAGYALSVWRVIAVETSLRRS